MTLDELAIKYGSDKSSLSHNYTPFYEHHLPKNPKKLLEVGVLHGSSVRMWREYFPDCEVHALDLFIENPIPNIEGVVWHKGDQANYELLELLQKEDFDVIIDDGSHNARHQLITFFGLYNGKHYFIEDTQCNDEDFYSQGLPKEMRAKYLLTRLPYDGIVMDCQSPIVLIQSAKDVAVH